MVRSIVSWRDCLRDCMLFVDESICRYAIDQSTWGYATCAGDEAISGALFG